MAERDYSQRDIVDKLGIKPGHIVVFANEVSQIDADIRERILVRTGRPLAEEHETADVVFALIDDITHAVDILQYWRPRLKPNGAIWLITAKRGQADYVDQRELIAIGTQAEVVDNKVCSLSATRSAMRFVIRKRDRPV